MNELLFQLRFAGALALAALAAVALVHLMRYLYQGIWPVASDVPHHEKVTLLEVSAFSSRKMTNYEKPNFKKNNSEDELIARSFAITSTDFRSSNDLTELMLKNSGLTSMDYGAD
jgi:hypothetical protein